MALGRNSRGTALTGTPIFSATTDARIDSAFTTSAPTLQVSQDSDFRFAPAFRGGGGGSGRTGAGGVASTSNWVIDAPLAVPDMDALLRRMREEVPEVELGRPPRVRKISDEEKFTNMIYGMLSNGDPVSHDDMKKYLAITKKKRHIGRQERQYVHHPKDEDGKTTASISCDDIMP